MEDDKPDVAERIGRTVNELDIDFSSFTVAGWIVSCLSLVTGCAAGWFAWQAMPKRKGPDDGPALVLGLTMIGVTVGAFLILRWLSSKSGWPVVRPPEVRDDVIKE